MNWAFQSTQSKDRWDYDPLGQLTRTGGFYISEQDGFCKEADRLLLAAENELPQFRVLHVNSHLFSDSGSNLFRNWPSDLSMAAEYFTRLTAMGHQCRGYCRAHAMEPGCRVRLFYGNCQSTGCDGCCFQLCSAPLTMTMQKYPGVYSQHHHRLE